ncbi:hypothetical protein T12_12208 [Trichinella patagoniensis]|uniref:Uncharacterized protein n=1 Tax=Trichinella patagoniensis TaxID=990121 RepID=A0A0V0ZI49_9BILA|nr:hypothetical protein T12_12208 [Trichinella patagoniensis]
MLEDEYYLRKHAGHHFISLLELGYVWTALDKRTVYVEVQFTLINELDVHDNLIRCNDTTESVTGASRSSESMVIDYVHPEADC